MAPPLEILCITTGGSIDKTYSSLASDFVCAAPVLKGLLRDVKCAHRVAFQEICRKDSLELTDGDRDAVVAAVAGAAQTHVLVTHGTDTLWKTALALKPAALKAGKVVALTGSMRPAAFAATDAHFNVGGAVAVLPYLPPGAHIVMNGRVFSEPDRIVEAGAGHKNRQHDFNMHVFARVRRTPFTVSTALAERKGSVQKSVESTST